MEHFSHKNGHTCGVSGYCNQINDELSLNGCRLLVIQYFSKQYTTKELKNKAVLSLKVYCMQYMSIKTKNNISIDTMQFWCNLAI